MDKISTSNYYQDEIGKLAFHELRLHWPQDNENANDADWFSFLLSKKMSSKLPILTIRMKVLGWLLVPGLKVYL